MTRLLRPAVLAAVLVSLLSAPSGAEKMVPVTPPGGVYVQPSTVAYGSTVHVAFLGADNAAGPFRVYYGAVNGASDFTNLTLTKDSPGFMTTKAVAVVDNSAVPGDSYADARHPKIALRSPDRVVIFFQAKASPADNAYALYRAQLSLAGGLVAGISVRAVSGIPAGDVRDVAFGLAAADNTARIAYSFRGAPAGSYDVRFARIGLDNASAVRPPILLSAFAGTTGSRPVPNLKLDGLNRAHVAWAADNGTPGTPSGICYAMVKEFNDPSRGGIVDNAAIGATGVIGRDRRWGHPQILVSPTSNSLLFLLATDAPAPGVSGSLAWANLNPDAAPQDNNPVSVATNTAFLLAPPGVSILPASFDLYRAEAHVDLGGRIHLTGYGNAFSAPVYYAAKPIASHPFLEFLTSPMPVGFGNGAASYELPDDYTKASFAFLGGKGVVFWSGTDNTAPEKRALLVAGLPTINEWVVAEEKGCSVAAGRGSASPLDLLWIAIPLAILKVAARFRRGCVAS